MPTDATYRQWLAEAVDRLTASIANAERAATVPTCPGWDVTSLVEHVVGIHEWVIEILTTTRAANGGARRSPDGDSPQLATWYREHADRMQQLMAAADPDAPCWNFSGVNTTYGFWPRRQTHEVTVHTFDVLAAAGLELDVDPLVAADGIDELLTVFGVRMPARGYPADLVAPILVEPTDAAASWTLGPAVEPGGPVTVTSGAADAASAALRGTASDLLLVLWKRLPAGRLAIDGDRAVVDAYLGSRLAP